MLEPLITEEQIRERVDALARAIEADATDGPLVLVGVLKGSLYFLADLSRRLKLDHTIDLCQVRSYGDGQSSSGVVRILKDLDKTIEGKHVLIVEDIVDTGLTITHLRELFATRKPKSVKVVSLLSKPAAQRHRTEIEYVGFEIPNAFVVGYGLDYAERYRNLPYIAILRH